MKKLALLSVSDKTGLIPFASGLIKLGFHLLSTGGTSKAIAAAGLAVEDISHFTGFPEMMDGRVKTLHPKVHGGILQLRDNSHHQAEAKAIGILPIDLICVNLYPFEKAVADPQCTLENAIENIDIGGPAMLRSSAKNYRHVVVVTDAADYPTVLDEYEKNGDVSLSTRETFALKVFRLTSHYDGAIHTYLSRRIKETENVKFAFENGKPLRYGENPHQKAKLFSDPEEKRPNVPGGNLLHGKEMSYNNYLDADASFETAWEFREECAAVIVKHGNPCGIATAASPEHALKMAWEGDIVSAFGSVITLTRPVDLATAEFLKGKFVEVLIAPGFSPEALEFLKNKSKDIRLIEVPPLTGVPDTEKMSYRFVRGALLAQTEDRELMAKLESVTKIKFP
ncbi:MAG: bifunctional phosphoribosylaminoimidazolecarboxamide formyltransferase/IMP cyclohydrolase, partial [Spirochaetia bacterium]|nr:bifunctional phosphoribosylaminoimidazolecarboxamide formyltransferase/IMP cyclohydrolase [Spirochaetia bacterium]